MLEINEFAAIVNKANTNGPVEASTKSIMVLDPDGDLLFVKDLEWDPENDCWIISLEN